MIAQKPHTAAAPTVQSAAGFTVFSWTFYTATLGTLTVLDPPDVYRFQAEESDTYRFKAEESDTYRFQAEEADEYRL